MSKLNYNEYKELNGMFAVMSKSKFVKYTVHRNLHPIRRNSRSINGGEVGNRHALKHGFRMWDHSGKVIDRGAAPIQRREYSPDF